MWPLMAAVFCFVLLLGWLLWSAPRHPVALIRVVDAAGKPVAGAVIRPEGLRTKAGPYVSGWYGWVTDKHGVPNTPVSTDANGYAHVPYPKYVFERIETGTIICSFSHPDFVPARPERVVTTTPPAGAPWRLWFDELWGRVQHKALIAHVDPVVLEKGATLKLSVRPGSGATNGAGLFAQLSVGGERETNFWIRPEPGVLVTHRLAPGVQTVRAVQVETNGAVWFSDVQSITAVSGQTNELVVDLKRGVSVHGQLDATVPRPVRNGRVVAHVGRRVCDRRIRRRNGMCGPPTARMEVLTWAGCRWGIWKLWCCVTALSAPTGRANSACITRRNISWGRMTSRS